MQIETLVFIIEVCSMKVFRANKYFNLKLSIHAFIFLEAGASKIPCLPTYAGPKPFSEPETLALSEFIKTFKNLKLYLSFHSFSQLLIFPYVSNSVKMIVSEGRQFKQ